MGRIDQPGIAHRSYNLWETTRAPEMGDHYWRHTHAPKNAYHYWRQTTRAPYKPGYDMKFKPHYWKQTTPEPQLITLAPDFRFSGEGEYRNHAQFNLQVLLMA